MGGSHFGHRRQHVVALSKAGATSNSICCQQTEDVELIWDEKQWFGFVVLVASNDPAKMPPSCRLRRLAVERKYESPMDFITDWRFDQC